MYVVLVLQQKGSVGVTINILLDSNVLVLNNVKCIVKYLLHLK